MGIYLWEVSEEGESEGFPGVNQPRGENSTQKLCRREVTGKEGEQKRPQEGERAGDSCT